VFEEVGGVQRHAELGDGRDELDKVEEDSLVGDAIDVEHVAAACI